MMDTEDRPSCKKLSKGVLELKFMKKSKEKAELQEENEEREKLYQDQLSSLHKGADRIIMVESYFDCMDFLPCRLSFGGMDPDIEKLNEEKLTGVYKIDKPKEKPTPKLKFDGMDVDVTAEEMANYSGKLGDKAREIMNKRKSEPDDSEENLGQDSKFFRGNSNRRMRPIFKHVNTGEGPPSNRGGGGFRGRGMGNFTDRGRGDFNSRGRGDFNNRGRGNFNNLGRGNFNNRGRGGDFSNRGQGNFKGGGEGSFSK